MMTISNQYTGCCRCRAHTPPVGYRSVRKKSVHYTITDIGGRTQHEHWKAERVRLAAEYQAKREPIRQARRDVVVRYVEEQSKDLHFTQDERAEASLRPKGETPIRKAQIEAVKVLLCSYGAPVAPRPSLWARFKSQCLRLLQSAFPQ